jgi:hypothetical protein
MIAEGKYKGRCTGGRLGKTKDGAPKLTLDFELETDHGVIERLSRDNMLSGKSLDYTIQTLRTCGWEGYDLADLTGITANPVRVVVKHREWNGKTYAEIKSVFPLVAGLDGDEAAQIAADLRADIIAAAKRDPKLAGKQPVPADDELPF